MTDAFSAENIASVFDHDPNERGVKHPALTMYLERAFLKAALEWTEYHRGILISLPDVGTVSLWQPNLFFSMPS